MKAVLQAALDAAWRIRKTVGDDRLLCTSRANDRQNQEEILSGNQVMRAMLLLMLASATVSASAADGGDETSVSVLGDGSRYAVVRATDGWWGQRAISRAEQALVASVNSAIARGYQPVGGVNIVSTPQAGTTVSQAMVRAK